MTNPLASNPIPLPLLGAVPIPRSAVDGRGREAWTRSIGWSVWRNWRSEPRWADVRAAWSEAGLAFAVHVQGKSQPPWCRDVAAGRQRRPASLDRHPRRPQRPPRRPLLPPVRLSAGRRRPRSSTSRWPSTLPINRAREQPNPIRPGLLKARCQRQGDGYILEAFIPAEALTGFDPAEHPRLGFTYAVIDRELGEQTFGVGSPMPYQEDPSLWATLELVR